MLVQITIGNYKTFRDEVKLTLFASNYDKTTREAENVFELPKFGLRLLKSAVMYGANASGKTKFIDAAHFMKKFVLESSKDTQAGSPIKVEPFRLSTEYEKKPVLFEVVFIHNDEMFRYGFELTPKAVHSEWLFQRANTKEVEIFFREGQNFSVHNKLKKGKFLVKEKMVRDNALLVSVAAQFGDELATSVINWFQGFRQLSGLQEDAYLGYTMARALENKERFLSLLEAADIGISDISTTKLDTDQLPKHMPEELKDFIKKKIEEENAVFFGHLNTFHPIFDKKNQIVGQAGFRLDKEESSGTQKYFALLGPILNALDDGAVLFVDEIDAKLHPNLTEKLVELFNNTETNPRNAQLVFNTHNSNLLSRNLFRRDQIWFVEKNRQGAATLFPLSSFKTDEGARKSDNFEVKYLQGKYGGVPILGDFEISVLQPENELHE